MSNNVVIVAATRTPIGRFQGSLKQISAVDLGAAVIKSLLEQTKLLPEQINEVILGHILTAGCGQNTARQASVKGGLLYSTPAMTINKVCGSALKAVHLATQAIRCKDADIIIAGGMESMSQAPFIVAGNRSNPKIAPIDTLVHDGLWDVFNDCHMGITAENLAQKYNISRQQQDEFALTSQQKAIAAITAGKFKKEITPILIPQEQTLPILFDTDEQPRPQSSIEKLARLKPVFKEGGTVTAGNASSINDGAAAVIITTEQKANQLGLPILARIVSYASAGVDPAFMGIGPAYASKKCLEKANWSVDELDIIESNEAFASQAIAVNKETGWDINKVNVNGGAIALGHPIGSAGCRILVSLIHEMIHSNQKKGLATLCIGGGMGVAIAIER